MKDHHTGACCARLCLRKHDLQESGEDAIQEVRTTMKKAMTEAVRIASELGCDVEIDGEYLIAYLSVEK